MAVVSFVRHKVADFDAWKAVYDGVKDVQKAGGVMAHGVFRDEEDPNLVIVLHTFEDAEHAHAFFQNAELRQAMVNAGVDVATMRLSFANEVAFGRL